MPFFIGKLFDLDGLFLGPGGFFGASYRTDAEVVFLARGKLLDSDGSLGAFDLLCFGRLSFFEALFVLYWIS